MLYQFLVVQRIGYACDFFPGDLMEMKFWIFKNFQTFYEILSIFLGY